MAVGIIAKLHPPKDGEDGSPSVETEDHEGEKHAIAQELIHAVHSGDAAGVVSAFEGLFQCMEESPHEEDDGGMEE